jgi:hypothetical protein
MRCKETTGFLMLRRCENEAMFQCCYCGVELCGEHSNVVYESQPPPVAASPNAPQKPPMGGQTVACKKCLHLQQGQGQGASRVYDDPYYSYPYYGSYRPYFYGYGYSDRDRRVFERENQPLTDAGASDAFGS